MIFGTPSTQIVLTCHIDAKKYCFRIQFLSRINKAEIVDSSCEQLQLVFLHFIATLVKQKLLGVNLIRQVAYSENPFYV